VKVKAIWKKQGKITAHSRWNKEVCRCLRLKLLSLKTMDRGLALLVLQNTVKRRTQVSSVQWQRLVGRIHLSQ
jgi:hypothetical protein